MKEYNIKGQLKPLEWFLENDWYDVEDYIEEFSTGFILYYIMKS